MKQWRNISRTIRVVGEQFSDVNNLSYLRELVLTFDKGPITSFVLEKKFSERTWPIQEALGRSKLSISKKGRGSTCLNWIRVVESMKLIQKPSASSLYSLTHFGKILKELHHPSTEDLKNNCNNLTEAEKIFFLFLLITRDGDHFFSFLKSVNESKNSDELKGSWSKELLDEYNEIKNGLENRRKFNFQEKLKYKWAEKDSGIILGNFQLNLLALYTYFFLNSVDRRKKEIYLSNIQEIGSWAPEGSRNHRINSRIGFCRNLGLIEKENLNLTESGRRILDQVKKYEISDLNKNFNNILIELKVKGRDVFPINTDYYYFDLTSDNNEDYLNTSMFSLIFYTYFTDKPKTFDEDDFIRNLDDILHKFGASLAPNLSTNFLYYYSIIKMASLPRYVINFRDILNFLDKPKGKLNKAGYTFLWSSMERRGWLEKRKKR